MEESGNTHENRPRATRGIRTGHCLATPRACVLADACKNPATEWGCGGSGVVAAERKAARVPAARPPRRWSRSTGRSPGSRAGWRPCLHPLPALVAQWVPDLADRVMWLYSTTVAGAAPEFDRLPVLPEPALAGSPVGGRTVGKAGGDVKKGAVLWRLAIRIVAMPHSEFLATALEAARAADDVVRHYYQRNLKITLKADKSPVTEADVETEKAIRSLIAPSSRRTVSTARKPAPPRSTRTTSGSSTRSTAPRRSCASTRCSRPRSR